MITFKILSVLLLLTQYLSIEASEYTSPYPRDRVDKLAAEGLVKLEAYQAKYHPTNKCTVKNAIKRKEWSNLSPKERIAYTNAVLCLQSKKSITPPTFAPGARSRVDDLVITHMNQTYSIHGTGNFLGWHRYFVHAYEKSLKTECGYKGHSPYWNWGRYAETNTILKDPINSPLFDGSATSLGSNGRYSSYNGTLLAGTIIPPGEGGGCVTTGPFKNIKVNLGPKAASVQGTPPDPDTVNVYGYNPRCLRRDVNPYASAVTRDIDTYNLITKKQNKDIYWFQTDMLGYGGKWGVHAGGHFTVGGDPGGDFFTSPGDPAFYLHHGQIDRIWWIWQNHNLPYSRTAISGTLTWGNNPPSINSTIEDKIGLGLNGREIRLGNIMTTLGGDGGEWGKLCYIYV